MALFCASGSHVPRAVPVLTETPERSNYLFCRIIPRKTVSHFCWKCSNSTLRSGSQTSPFSARHNRNLKQTTAPSH
ncbi:hypothetical protein CK815_08385 [Brucella abortus]|nr:hypothetical protein CK815_08385 [Brucella abortus]